MKWKWIFGINAFLLWASWIYLVATLNENADTIFWKFAAFSAIAFLAAIYEKASGK